MGADLRATVVIDYQNVHLTGHGLFAATRHLPKHETLVDPLHFSNQLIAARNTGQDAGFADAVLRRVLVYRGQPSQEHDANGYARSLAQMAQWERDRKVRVTLRPLKYEYMRGADGRHATDVHGNKIVTGPPREKGVDVLCALALVRKAGPLGGPGHLGVV